MSSSAPHVSTSGIADHVLADFTKDAVAASKGTTTVSVCIPARNEAATIGAIVAAIDTYFAAITPPIVDELIVFDDGSIDATAEIASAAGAIVVDVATVLPECGEGSGKGNVLWKSVAQSTGDIVVWLDADLTSFEPEWILGLIGPMLIDPETALVKGAFERPETEGSGGGRTTEIMVRPLFSTFFPPLADLRQPLAGEYAARRTVLEHLPFSMGYGVEAGLLIDLVEAMGVTSLAQVDLGVRTHRSRPVTELSGQAMEILHVVLARAGMQQQSTHLRRPGTEPIEIQIEERPPLRSVSSYRRTS